MFNILSILSLKRVLEDLHS